MIRTSFSVRSRRGVSRSCSSSTGRAFTYKSNLNRRPSNISAACWLEGTRGSPSAPKSMASNSSRSISNRPCRERYSLPQELVRPPIKLDEFQSPLPRRGDRAQHLHPLRSDFLPNPVTRNNSDRAAAPPARCGRFDLFSWVLKKGSRKEDRNMAARTGQTRANAPTKSISILRTRRAPP